MILRILVRAMGICFCFVASGGWVKAQTLSEPLLRDPSRAEWNSLARFNRTLTRAEFEDRLNRVFDPFRGLTAFLQVTDHSVKVFAASSRDPLVEIQFARSGNGVQRPPVVFRQPSAFAHSGGGRPLAGLRVVIEPADIGGEWGGWDDRSTLYRGYGRIQEGDLNLTVAKELRQRLRLLGATVFLTRETAEPVAPYNPQQLDRDTRETLSRQMYTFPPAYYQRSRGIARNSERGFQVAREVLFAKVIEQRARAAKVQRQFKPDITIVIQHDASPSSGRSRLTSVNRNIFFVSGAYQALELKSDPHQRFRLLTKLLENVTPVETEVAVNISKRFQAVTGAPPVGYGNSSNTRAIGGANRFVVARNLAFNREHNGPVVVTEPYFMNESVTLQRLLAGDYEGTRMIAGKQRESIFREYANCVAGGLVNSYAGPR
jgi:N-acetylmuramoyl-L-alanine amidase